MCAGCEPGTFSNAEASTTCQECAPGYYAATRGQSSCSVCGQRTFANETRMSSCTACAASLGNNDDDDVADDLVSLRSRVGCQEAGPLCFNSSKDKNRLYYYDVWLEKCVACKTCRTETFETAWCNATNDTQCKACTVCKAGEFQVSTCTNKENRVCDSCAAGQFLLTVKSGGSSSCQNCAPGTISASRGSTNCSVCAPGTYPTPNRTFCTGKCGAGAYLTSAAYDNDKDGVAESHVWSCELCPAGTFGPGDDGCYPCVDTLWKSNPLFGAGATACSTCSGGGVDACSYVDLGISPQCPLI